VRCDVAKWPDLQNLSVLSKQEFGTVPDVWVANAGIYEPAWSNFWDDTEDDQGHYAAVSINVEHPIKLTRIAIRSLLSENKKGVVLCVSSLSGLRSKYGSVLYCATKHAIVGFVKGMGLAEELEGVKVVAICPGCVHELR
jgi:NAD(P)-dependent dehydrogenase (short-subunit alcohol dehydrogenase family)